MTCTQCKREIAEYSAYCSYCGSRQNSGAPHRRLMRSATDSKIAGVCGGLGEYLNVDPTIVRLVWVILSICPGGFIGGIVAYTLAWIIIPKAPHAAGAPASAPMEQAAKT